VNSLVWRLLWVYDGWRGLACFRYRLAGFDIDLLADASRLLAVKARFGHDAQTSRGAPVTINDRFDARFAGASLISAVGSLPLHVLPILIASTVVNGTLVISEAGWVAAALMLGNLTSSIALPSLGFKSLSLGQVLLAVVLFIGGIASTSSGSVPILLFGWLLTGLACGAMLFFGVTVMSANAKLRWAFTVRLGYVLALASAVALLMLAMQTWSRSSSYLHLLSVVLAVTVVLCGLALALSRCANDPAPAGASPGSARPPAQSSIRVRFRRSGMTITLLLFAGQTGFWIYSGIISDQKGYSLTTFIWAVSVAKALASIYLFARTGSNESSAARSLLLGGAGCIVGILLMYSTDWVAAFIGGLVFWQIAFNSLSARLQGELIAVDPGKGGRWLTAVIMVGTALGPLFHGATLHIHAEAIFVLLCCMSALLPYLWFVLATRYSREAQARGNA
jgi:hypothetical protein